jgi:hypothetical protein
MTYSIAFHPEHVLDATTDEGLDALNDFVFQYCDDHGIKCDGGVFGMMFSGLKQVWTQEEAIALIEEGARTYGLKKKGRK